MNRSRLVSIALAVLIVLQLATLGLAVAAWSKVTAIGEAVSWVGQSAAAACKALRADPCP